jgi:hypothetical protein
MSLKAPAYSFLSTLSRPYPKEFQDLYGEDLKSVFLDILEDPDGSEKRQIVRSLGKEFLCLPGCLIREYPSTPAGDRLKSTRQIVLSTTLRSTAVFMLLSVEFGLLRVIGSEALGIPAQIRFAFLLLNGILFGLLVGGSIGFALSYPH